MDRRRQRTSVGPVWLAAALVLAACASPTPTPSNGQASPSQAEPSGSASQQPGSSPGQSTIHVYAAGDIAGCDTEGDEATAALLEQLQAEHPGPILALGDLAYPDGSAADFANCYDPTWGRYRADTIPTPGNHEYHASHAEPYFDYFGAAAGSPGQGWSSQALGPWQLFVLNSNCGDVGGCRPSSAQEQWLEANLAGVPADTCVIAIWHHPRWSSGGEHGSDERTKALWQALADVGADVVLTGHDHDYERFEPMDAKGQRKALGLVEFVVGTGGRSHYAFGRILPTSVVHDSTTFGVLDLTLRPGGYDWAFVPASPGGFTDAGSASCR